MKTVRDKFGIWALVYTLVGAVAFPLYLSVAKPNDVWQFLLYLVCANVAVLGLRLMAGHGLLSAGFLILLLGVEDLSLPELLFIACHRRAAGANCERSARGPGLQTCYSR